MKSLLQVSLRQQAVYLPDAMTPPLVEPMTDACALLTANLGKLGFTVSEPLLHALNHASPATQAEVLQEIGEVLGVQKNWTPLVKGWDVATGESRVDHLMTFFANVFGARGTTLACGHIIPPGTFPLERYNGCPFCGTPFEFGALELKDEGSKKKVLELWCDEQVTAFFRGLLQSKTALDATQTDSLRILIAHLPLPDVAVEMKETLMSVIDLCVEQDQDEKAGGLLQSPADILRYLWFKKTGHLQVVEPKTIIRRTARNSRHFHPALNERDTARAKRTMELKLRYSRRECFRVATWLNCLPMPAARACEIMHAKRGMWVRFIRALRLAEFARRDGFAKLREVLDLFYRQAYPVFGGTLQAARLRRDVDQTFLLLKQRPGLFARSLFANMLWFTPERALAEFREVIDQVPARLVFTLQSMAQIYFQKTQRLVKPLGGVRKTVPAHPLVLASDEDALESMKAQIDEMCLFAMEKRFAALPTKSKTIHIAPLLFKMPVSIGERSETVQDLPAALMGSRFELEGDTVRLFMQWGAGLPAQYLDMDLSCHIAFDGKHERCAYSNLVATGCKHSGDIRQIPEKVGTAEYIEISMPVLLEKQARFVTFTCNAYSSGALSPNLVVGWMSSLHPMSISKKTGIAYDPSCVQHQVRITQNLTKGLVFGVLDVIKREIIWLEMAFSGQVVQSLDTRGVQTLLNKLDSRLSVGNLLMVKAKAQGLSVLDQPGADENYTMEWARNTAEVTKLLIDA